MVIRVNLNKYVKKHMPQIFISFSKDFKITLKLKELLENQGFDVWIYLEDIPPTTDWLEEIYRGIESSSIFLFLISPDSITSDTCQKEIDHASKNGKRIIPLLIRQVDFKALRPEISRIQAISFEKPDNFDPGFETLLKYINTDFAWVQFHTKLQGKALDWEKSKEKSLLLRGNELQNSERTLASITSQVDPQPTDLQRKFIQESRKYAKNTLRRLTVLILGAAFVMLFLGVIALRYSITAKRQENLAISRQLADEALNVQNQPDLALLLSVQAYNTSPTFEAKRSLFTTLTSNSNMSTYLYTRSGSIENLAFTSEDNHLYVSISNGNLQTWDLSTNSLSKEIISGKGIFPVTAFNLTSQKIAHVINRNITFLDLKGNVVSSIDAPRTINCAVFSPNGKTLITGSGNLESINSKTGEILFWDAENLNEIDTSFSVPFPVQSIAINPEGTILAVGGQALILLDATSHSQLHDPIKNIVVSNITSLSFSSDGKFLLVGSEAPGPASEGGAIGILDLETLEYITEPKTSSTPRVNSIAILNNYFFLSNGGRDANLLIKWSVNSNDPINQFKGHVDQITVIAISEEGGTIATGDVKGNIIVWEKESKYSTFHIGIPINLDDIYLFGNGTSNEKFVDFVQFSPDGLYVIGKDIQNNIIGWDIQTGKKVNSIDYQISQAKDVRVLSSAYNIEAVAEENGIVLFEATTGLRIGVLPIRAGYLALSPDGNYLLSYGYFTHAYIGESPHIWNIDPDFWALQACSIANRDLTQDEWDKYLPNLPYQETCTSLLQTRK